jgi:hypothetical protein
MFARSDIYFRLHLLLITIHITCILLSLRRTSAPIHLTSLLGVLGTQETSCIVIAGLLGRDCFDLLLPEFDKSWVIHLRETCCCSTNLYTCRPNTIYKNTRMHRHQASLWWFSDLNWWTPSLHLKLLLLASLLQASFSRSILWITLWSLYGLAALSQCHSGSLHGLASVTGGLPSALGGSARLVSGQSCCRCSYPNVVGICYCFGLDLAWALGVVVMACRLNPVGNPKRKVWWAQQQDFPQLWYQGLSNQ